MLQKFSPYEKDHDVDWPELTKPASEIVRKIDEFPNAVNWSLSVRNIRIQKGCLRRYFAHIYSARLASKLLALFDFSMPLDYRSFYK